MEKHINQQDIGVLQIFYPDGRPIVDLRVEIPQCEKWLFNNKNTLIAVLNGLKQSAEGKTRYVSKI